MKLPIALTLIAFSCVAKANYYFRLPVPTLDTPAPTPPSLGGCTNGNETIYGNTNATVDKLFSIPSGCTNMNVELFSAGGASGYVGRTGAPFSPRLITKNGSVYIEDEYALKTKLSSTGYSIMTSSGSPGLGGAAGNGGNGSELAFNLALSGDNTFTAYISAPSLGNTRSLGTALIQGNKEDFIAPGYQGGSGGNGGAAGGSALVAGHTYNFHGGNSSSINGANGASGYVGVEGIKDYSSNYLSPYALFTPAAGGAGGNGKNATTTQAALGSPGKIVISWH